MNNVLYLTKQKIFSKQKEWLVGEGKLAEVLAEIKKELKLSKVRLVLGNDLSFVVSMKCDDDPKRDQILQSLKKWLPFEVNDQCMDWRKIVIGKENWAVAVAIEREYLEMLSASLLNNGIEAELVTTIGVLMAEQSKDKKIPMIYTWSGKEDLTVLSVWGMPDLIMTGKRVEEARAYGLARWGGDNAIMETELGAEFDVFENATRESIRGSDEKILSIPMLRRIMVKEESASPVLQMTDKQEAKVDKRKPVGWMALLAVVILMIVGGGGWFLFGKNTRNEELKTTEGAVTLTPSASPTEDEMDPSEMRILILNGSGVTGEAGKKATLFEENGFLKPMTGNTEATSSTTIRYGANVPLGSKKLVMEVLGEDAYEENSLTAEDKYDLIIILGGTDISGN